MSTLIIGIDPGSRITGFGIIEENAGKLRHVESGCIHSETGTFTQRLKIIFQELQKIVAQYPLQEAAIEDIFYHRNAGAALKLGQARGSAIVALAQINCEVMEYSTRQIKQAIVGFGGAGKPQIQHMVRVLLGLNVTPKPDAADALAVAICHAHMRQTNLRMQNMTGYRRGRVLMK